MQRHQRFDGRSLRSLSTLALLAACSSSSSTSTATDAGAPLDAGAPSDDAASAGEAGPLAKSSGACSGDGGVVVAAVEDAGTSGCPLDYPTSSADLDQYVGWKCPNVAKQSCTAAEIAAVTAAIKGGAPWATVADATSASCKACVVSNETDPAWGPVVVRSDGMKGSVNYGACAGYLVSATCGRAFQYEQDCYQIVCSECSSATCVQDARNGICQAFAAERARDCTPPPACDTIEQVLATLCGS